MASDKPSRDTTGWLAADPHFSAAELRALFRVLDVAGDPANARDRERAIAALNETLADEERTEALISALNPGETVEGRNGVRQPAPNQQFEPVFVHHELSTSDRRLMEDTPSVGKLIGAIEAHSAEESTQREGETPHELLAHSDSWLMPGERWWEQPLTPAANQTFRWEEFFSRALEALPQPTLWERVFRARRESIAAIERSDARQRIVRVTLSYGEKEWYCAFLLHDKNLTLHVEALGQESIEKELEARNPTEFSNYLVTMFNGEIAPAKLTLKSVRNALHSRHAGMTA